MDVRSTGEVIMTPRDFCFWLQGYAEVSNVTNPTDDEWTIVCDHLKLSTIEDGTSPEGQFIIWLCGFVDLAQTTPHTDQWNYITERLQNIFTKVIGDAAEAREKLGPILFQLPPGMHQEHPVINFPRDHLRKGELLPRQLPHSVRISPRCL